MPVSLGQAATRPQDMVEEPHPPISLAQAAGPPPAQAPEEAPQLSGTALGVLPGAKPGFPGRKVWMHTDGTNYSTHYNIVTNIGGKDYIIPTIYNGKVVSEDDARAIAIRNKLIDPETGHPFAIETAPSRTGMGRVEQAEHDRLERASDAALRRTPQGRRFLQQRQQR
jgi:hypothetical protein